MKKMIKGGNVEIYWMKLQLDDVDEMLRNEHFENLPLVLENIIQKLQKLKKMKNEKS
jgi:hypothetical protein